MTFDKSKVYTSLNADELEVGSEVIVAYDLDSLKYQVEANLWPTYVKKLDEVLGPDHIHRFKLPDSRAYNLAYLVGTTSEEEPKDEKWIVYLARYGDGFALFCYDEGYWETAKKFDGAKTKLFVGSEDEAKEWCNSRERFSEVIKAWEDGEEIQYKEQTSGQWVSAFHPAWDLDTEYRVKPNGLVCTDLKVGNILRRAGERPAPLGEKHEYVYVEERRMVTGIVDDPETKHHVQLGGDWIGDDDLEKWSVEE